jgi:hypothetical protein
LLYRDLSEDNTDLHQISISVVSLQNLYVFNGETRGLEVVKHQVQVADQTHSLEEHLLNDLLIIRDLVGLHKKLRWWLLLILLYLSLNLGSSCLLFSEELREFLHCLVKCFEHELTLFVEFSLFGLIS